MHITAYLLWFRPKPMHYEIYAIWPYALWASRLYCSRTYANLSINIFSCFNNTSWVLQNRHMGRPTYKEWNSDFSFFSFWIAWRCSKLPSFPVPMQIFVTECHTFSVNHHTEKETAFRKLWQPRDSWETGCCACRKCRSAAQVGIRLCHALVTPIVRSLSVKWSHGIDNVKDVIVGPYNVH